MCCQIYCTAQIQKMQIGEHVSISIGLTEANVLRYWASKGLLYDTLELRCTTHVRDLETQLKIQQQVISVSQDAATRYASLYGAAVQSRELDSRYIETLEAENRRQKSEMLKFSKTTTRDLFIWGGAGILALAITQIIVQNN